MQLLLYIQEVHKMLQDKRAANRLLVENISAAALVELKACADQACLDDMDKFNELFWPKANRANDCPD